MHDVYVNSLDICIAFIFTFQKIYSLCVLFYQKVDEILK